MERRLVAISSTSKGKMLRTLRIDLTERPMVAPKDEYAKSDLVKSNSSAYGNRARLSRVTVPPTRA
jgi:hypothetical protein